MVFVNCKSVIKLPTDLAYDHRVLKHLGIKNVLYAVIHLATEGNPVMTLGYKDETRGQTTGTLREGVIAQHPIPHRYFGLVLNHLFKLQFSDSQNPTFCDDNLFSVTRGEEVELYKLSRNRVGAGGHYNKPQEHWELWPMRGNIEYIGVRREFYLFHLGEVA